MSLEDSIDSGAPREFYRIQHGVIEYLVASGQRDIEYAGDLYMRSPVARLELSVSVATADLGLTIALPSSHAFSRRYVAMMSPPQQISVTVYRMQSDGEVTMEWLGYVTSMSTDSKSHVSKFLISSRIARSLQRTLPSLLVDTRCAHVLYDSGCLVDRASFRVDATVTVADGKTITVSTMGGRPTEWARFGELYHVPSGERMTIFEQVGNVIKMQAQIVGLRRLDAVQVFAGCAHDRSACRDTFNNMVNYGGLPDRPTRNPFFPTGLGVGDVK
jgi:hypothetical protein